MKNLLKLIMRLFYAVVAGFILYSTLVTILDSLSGWFEKPSLAYDLIETLPAFLAPMTFGFSVLLFFIMVSYWLMPRWLSQIKILLRKINP
jgi:hypothetical protein